MIIMLYNSFKKDDARVVLVTTEIGGLKCEDAELLPNIGCNDVRNAMMITLKGGDDFVQFRLKPKKKSSSQLDQKNCYKDGNTTSYNCYKIGHQEDWCGSTIIKFTTTSDSPCTPDYPCKDSNKDLFLKEGKIGDTWTAKIKFDVAFSKVVGEIHPVEVGEDNQQHLVESTE